MQPLDPDKLPNPCKGMDPLSSVGSKDANSDEYGIFHLLGSAALVSFWLRVFAGVGGRWSWGRGLWLLRGTYFGNHPGWFLLLLPFLAMIWFPLPIARIKSRSAWRRGRFQNPDEIGWRIRMCGWGVLIIFLVMVSSTANYQRLPPPTSIIPWTPTTTNQAP
jgi:hypothetical protein